MTEPFLSEIKIVSFNFPPKGHALCNGQLLPINQNQALFSLLGTTYGGNGQTTFALPDLRDRVPIHFGNGHTLGEKAGEEASALGMNEMPVHGHSILCSGQSANSKSPVGSSRTMGAEAAGSCAPYATTRTHDMAEGLLGSVGGSQAHPNMQPFLALNFIIALQGIFPSRT